MQHRMKLGKSPKRRIERIRSPDKLPNTRRFGFIQIEFCDVGRVEIHRGYRLRSSSMISVLSVALGILAQTLFMEAKILAFFAASMRGDAVTGRNSATGSPRRSITIRPPSAASRISFDVWM